MKHIINLFLIINFLNADLIKDNTLDVVVNTESNLLWQDDTQTLSNVSSWEDALNYCESLSLSGYSDWRLPNINELSSIASNDEESPFENTVSSNYWSSTTDASDNTKAWLINFDNESSDTLSKTSNYFIRCVGNMKTSCDGDSQKLESGICIEKTCEDDGYNCQTPPKINEIMLDTNSLFANLSIKFDANITLYNSYISSYLWDFGDDILSTKETPFHKYEEAGEYKVKLTVKDSNDLSDTFTKSITVSKEVDIKAKFLPSLNQALAPIEITFYDQSSAEDSISKWKWEIKDSTGNVVGISTKSSESTKNLSYEFDTVGDYYNTPRKADSFL